MEIPPGNKNLTDANILSSKSKLNTLKNNLKFTMTCKPEVPLFHVRAAKKISHIKDHAKSYI